MPLLEVADYLAATIAEQADVAKKPATITIQRALFIAGVGFLETTAGINIDF
ncbi:hypothetical protein [Spirosoma rigui]|uniref:hypothetical protein n=1 Tax=Spirosoma rigui TaxID=564064 RepID=UPI0012D37159|nr:hypothetical protein [Spirosoma rigui]